MSLLFISAVAGSGGPVEENWFHHKFRAARDGTAEWFEVTPEIEGFIIQRLADAGDDAPSPHAETVARDGHWRYEEARSA